MKPLLGSTFSLENLCANQVIATRAKIKPLVPKRPPCPPSSTIFAGGIPHKTTKEELVGHFSRFGQIARLTFPAVSAHDYRNKGFCFLTFESIAEATNVIKFETGHFLRGRRVF